MFGIFDGLYKTFGLLGDLGGICVNKKNLGVKLIFTSIIFLLFWMPLCNAQTDLEITGPTDAFEGDEVEFTITLDGEPTQARVTFENHPLVKYSNNSTGIVNFTMPSVPYEDKWYNVTASMLDGLTSLHNILVKNTTGILVIGISNQTIGEGEEFIVAIKCRDEPVVDAQVKFKDTFKTTDYKGEVKLNAPNVHWDTSKDITVTKTGYQPDTITIQVKNNEILPYWILLIFIIIIMIIGVIGYFKYN